MNNCTPKMKLTRNEYRAVLRAAETVASTQKHPTDPSLKFLTQKYREFFGVPASGLSEWDSDEILLFDFEVLCLLLFAEVCKP